MLFLKVISVFQCNSIIAFNSAYNTITSIINVVLSLLKLYWTSLIFLFERSHESYLDLLQILAENFK